MVAPSVGTSWSWPVLAAETVVTTFVIGALAFVFRPLIDEYLIRFFRRRKQDIRVLFDEWYSVPEREDAMLELKQQVENNAKRLDSMDASFQRDILRIAGGFKESLDTQTEIVRELAKDQRETSSKVDRILGRLEAWDGRERRETDR